MALDYIVRDGDMVVFTPLFENAVVMVMPGKIKGTGKTTIQGIKVCVSGDELQVEVPGCLYIAGAYLNGTGTLTIKELSGNQLTTKATSGGKAMILKGSQFKAEFKVLVKAMNVAGQPDPKSSYNGFGQFVPANTKIKAT